jgi:hypothetical protein
VTNINGNTASVINGATSMLTATVPVSPAPDTVAVDPVLHRAYVADTDGNTLTVLADVPAIVSGPPPNAVVGTPYRFALAASGVANGVFAVSAGSLPAGLTLDAASGVISGLPSTAGTTSVTITPAEAGDPGLPLVIVDHSILIAAAPPVAPPVALPELAATGADVMLLALLAGRAARPRTGGCGPSPGSSHALGRKRMRGWDPVGYWTPPSPTPRSP